MDEMPDKSQWPEWEQIKGEPSANWIRNFDEATGQYALVVPKDPYEPNALHTTAATSPTIYFLLPKEILAVINEGSPIVENQDFDFLGQMVIFSETQIYSTEQLPGWDLIVERGKDESIVDYRPAQDSYVIQVNGVEKLITPGHLVGYRRPIPYGDPHQAQQEWLRETFPGNDTTSLEDLDQKFRQRLLDQLYVA